MPHDSSPPCNGDDPASPWHDALTDGDTAVIFNDPAVKLVAEVASRETTPGIAFELGALRLVLARLLIEKPDLQILVPLLVRVVAVIFQAIRLQRALGTQGSESLIDAMGAILAEIDQAKRS